MSARRGGFRSRGQVVPLVAFGIAGLLSLGALAVDVGTWRYEQRAEQAAADSGAIAGAIELPYSRTWTSVATAARTDTATNGFTHDGVHVNVTVNQPPLTGGYAGNANAVEVIVQKTQPTFFSALFGRRSQSVSARSVAALVSATRNCIYGLDTNGPAITFNNATVIVPNCGIISNGNILANNSTVNASSIGYVGTNMNVYGNTYPAGQPLPAVPAVDPCVSVPGCAYLKANPPTSGSCVPGNNIYNSSSTITLSPGKYCNTAIFEGGGKVVFSPGVYDFENGFINNSAPELDGSGVTIYTNGGTMIINGNPLINLTAPATGATAGVLFFQPASNSNQFIVNSGSPSVNGGYAGMMYFPTGTIIIDGTLSTWLLVVAKDIVLNGGGVDVTSAAFPGGGHAVLAE